MKAAGVPGRQDYQDLAKQLARIKRKARELSQRARGRVAARARAGRPHDALIALTAPGTDGILRRLAAPGA